MSDQQKDENATQPEAAPAEEAGASAPSAGEETKAETALKTSWLAIIFLAAVALVILIVLGVIS
jgi:hypothetical protein